LECCSGVPCPTDVPNRRRKCPPPPPNGPECEDGGFAFLIPLKFDDDSVEIPLNNLGGYCGKDSTPPGECGVTQNDQEIIFKNVGIFDNDKLTLVVKNTSKYVPYTGNAGAGPNTDGHYNNGALGSVGQVNLKNGYNVDLEFEFRHSNGELAVVSGYFVFFDLDTHSCECDPVDDDCENCPACENLGRDVVHIPDTQIQSAGLNSDDDIILSLDTNLCVSKNNGETSFWSTSVGDGADNPDTFSLLGSQLTGLTTKQRKVAGAFAFTEESVLDITYEIAGPKYGKGRNLVFSALIYNCVPFG